MSETYSIRRSSCVSAGATLDSRADCVFLKILAPGLSANFPMDAKPELSMYMSAALFELLPATVDRLFIGKVETGSMDLLIRSSDATWALAVESPHMLGLVAEAYTKGMLQLERAGDFGGGALLPAFDAASTASARGRSSASFMDRAFWHHPGLKTYGNVTIKMVISSTREASTCAALCVNDPECTTFAFSFLERLCFLLSDVELALCDPQISTSCSAKNNALLAQVSIISRCRYCIFYQEDSSLLYCASTSNRCSTLREYNQCLEKSGCGESVKNFQVHCDCCTRATAVSLNLCV